MTLLVEIGKIHRDSVENLRENMNLRSNLFKMAYFVDFPPIFCLTAVFFARGGVQILVKYSPVIIVIHESHP